MLTVQQIDEAAASLEDEEGVPGPEQRGFSSAVAHAYSLAVVTDPVARRRLERAREDMDPLMQKWFDRLMERVERSSS
jgi:hypothetical protein